MTGPHLTQFRAISMKTCIRCKETKELSSFHKHKGMKDGRLNKCAKCVQECVAEWRIANPNSRKEEHAKRRNKIGFKTREEYLKSVSENAFGRKYVSLKYTNKRRTQTELKDEFDEFVFQEAFKLRELRKEITGINWHIDHIVPLNHKQACGLHNAYNFQVVPAIWNLKKRHSNMDEYFKVSGY